MRNYAYGGYNTFLSMQELNDQIGRLFGDNYN